MKILFQGDSITDMGRSRERDLHMGAGYPAMVAGLLGVEYPGRVECVNRGVSGDRIVDMYARWRADCVGLQPDVVSILVGINDLGLKWLNDNGVELDRFEQVYDMLLAYTRQCLPNVKLMVLEPFVALGDTTRERWEDFRRDGCLYAEAARRVAEKHGAVFVPLQGAFEEAARRAPMDFWLVDGVHPSQAGHMLIARAWMEAFRRQGWQ